jgi:hypothetical protein
VFTRQCHLRGATRQLRISVRGGLGIVFRSAAAVAALQVGLGGNGKRGGIRAGGTAGGGGLFGVMQAGAAGQAGRQQPHTQDTN